jgi:PPK2 family polyphosphate:nucleotide phosphotransferase
MNRAKLGDRFRVDRARRFRLDNFDAAETSGFTKEAADRMVAKHALRLADLQERLYAENSWALLIILQGVDAAGKDGVIKHVMAGLNPLGCAVHPFKAPTSDELAHDFLWRAASRLPRRGDIGIFNRSYYEEVLIVRVHEDLLEKQRLPAELVSRHIWKERFADINAFERHLVRNGTLLLKFHLRISRQEQKRRLLARLDEPAKRWKFSRQDLVERKQWGRYMDAYADMIRNTSTRAAPWYVVPSDNKWFARLIVSAVIVNALERLDLAFPKFDPAQLRSMKQMRRALEAE